MKLLSKKNVATFAATNYIVTETIKKAMGPNLAEIEDPNEVDKAVASAVLSQLATEASCTVPLVEFKSNNILFEEVTKICGLGEHISATETQDELIARWTEEASTVSKNPIFNSVAESMASRLTGANETIKGMKESVTLLTKEINDKTNEYIAADPFLHKHCNANDVNIAFDTFPFEALNVVGSMTNLKGYIHDEVGNKTPDNASQSHYRIAMEKFSSMKLKDDRVKDTTLTVEDKDAIVKAVNEANKDILSTTIREALNTLISGKKLIAMKNRIMNTYKRTETTEACVTMIGMITDLRGCSSEISKVMASMDLSDESTIVDSNISFTDDCTDLAAFYVNWHRENTFKNTVMFRNKALNPDLADRCKEAGIENLDLARHCNRVYGSATLPAYGLTFKAVTAQKETIGKKAEREDAQLDVRVRAGKVEKERNAFFTVVYHWLEGKGGENVPMGNELTNFVKHKAGYLATKNMTVEDLLYGVTITLFHRNTFVNILFDKLGAEYHRMVATNPNITVGDIAMTNVCTYAELVTDFISKKFMVK